jgi:hypothetical protein
MEFENVVVASKKDADIIIDRMFEIIRKFESVTIADVKDLVGTQNYIDGDEHWGWTNLMGAIVKKTDLGNYLIDLPAPRDLDSKPDIKVFNMPRIGSMFDMAPPRRSTYPVFVNYRRVIEFDEDGQVSYIDPQIITFISEKIEDARKEQEEATTEKVVIGEARSGDGSSFFKIYSDGSKDYIPPDQTN